MKRIVVLFLCMALLSGMAGCGKKENEESSEAKVLVEQEGGVMLNSQAPVSKDDQDPMPEDLVDITGPGSFVPQLNLSDEEILALDPEQVTWGPGVNMDDQNRPTACVGLQESYGKYDAWFLKGDSKNIYLTFDEGYENGYTPKILDALKEADVKAVFFITLPYAQSEPELVQRMIDEGHVVGNHSVNHKNMTTLSLEEMREEIMGLHDYVKENFGYEMFLFRNPEGAFSEQELAAAQSVGYQSTFWSFAYADWDPENQMDPSAALDKTLGALHPGAIYLLHAVSSTNAAIVTDFVKQAKEQGYNFVKWTPTE